MDKQDLLTDIGKRVRSLRQMRRMTQYELGELCGYESASKNSTINKIESGKSDIPISKLVALSQALGVSISYIVGESASEEEMKMIAYNRAVTIMKKKLSTNERETLMNDLEYYFSEGQ